MADDYDKAMDAIKEENKDMIEKDESFLSRAKGAAQGAASRAEHAVKGIQEKISQYKRGEQIRRQTEYEKKLPELERDVKVREQEAHLRALQNRKSKLDQEANQHTRQRFARVFGGGGQAKRQNSFSTGNMEMPSVGGAGAFSPRMGGGKSPMLRGGKAPMLVHGSMPSLFDKKPKRSTSRSIIIKLPRMK